MAHFAATPSDQIQRARWVRRVVIGINILLGIALIAGISAVGYALFLYGKIDRLSLGLGGRSVSKPINILLVGSDNRSDLSPAEKRSYGDVGGQRTDTIMLAHLDPDAKTIAVISFPRDLWLPIDGTGHYAKINSAYESAKSETDGAKALISTIKDNFNVPIDHYVEVDFKGFRSIVNAIGGVNVHFDTPARDLHSGFRIWNRDSNGCVRLFGDAALAYARSRYYEVYYNGYWHTDPSSDWGRIQRQQDFMKRVAQRAVSKSKGSALGAERLVRSAVNYVKLDSGFGLHDLLDLAKKYRSVDPASIQQLGAIPGTGGMTDGQSVIHADMEKADAMLEPFRRGGGSLFDSSGSGSSTSTVNAGDVKVRVLNGSGVNGQAGGAATTLQNEGFTSMGSGPAETSDFTKTVIRYAIGQEAKARLVQSIVNGPSVLQQTDLHGVDVELVTGSSFVGIKALPSPSTATSTPKSVSHTNSVTATTLPTTGRVGAPSTGTCPA